MTGSPITLPARRLMAIALSLAGTIVLAAALSTSSQAAETIACYSEETGTWTNPNADPGDVIRVEIESHCVGKKVAYRTRTFTKCAPRDCTWGWTPGAKQGSGAFVATFATYSAYRYLEMKVNGDRAMVYVTYDFHDDRKPNQASSYVLHREDD